MLKNVPYPDSVKERLPLPAKILLQCLVHSLFQNKPLTASFIEADKLVSPKYLRIGFSVFVFLFAMSIGKSFANVTVTPANATTVYACGGTFPTAYTTLSNILITEGAKGDFANGGPVTLILTAPTNFEFNAGVGSVSFTTGNNIASASISVTATTITITYSVSGTNQTDILTISGIQVRGINGTSGGNILRTAANPGTGTITGITNGTSNFGTLTSTNQTIPSITSASNGTTCNNTAQSYTITSSVVGTTYNWSRAAVSGISNATVSNQTSNPITETLVNTTTAPVNATYVITPTANTCSGPDFNYVVAVNPTATVNAVSSQVVCNNSATSAVPFSSPTTGGSIVYNWTNSNTAIGLAASGSGDIASFIATNSGAAPISGTVTVTPSYTNGGKTCTGTATTFTITVNPTATVNAIANQVACNNSTTTAITFSSSTTGGSIVYNWTNDNTSIGLAASGSGNIASFTATNSGTAPVTATVTLTPSYTNGGTTCTGTARTFTITVNPTATINSIPNQVVCKGGPTSAVAFNSPATGGSIAYNWTNSNTAIGLAASGTGNIASFIATNNGNAPITGTITVTPSYTNGGKTCTGTATTFTITVNPTATVNAIANQVACNNSATTAIIFSSPTTGGSIIYNWTNDNTSIGLAASGSGNIASFTAISGGTSPVIATITVTPSYTNGGTTCTGAARTFTITVNPTATVNSVSDYQLCNNDATGAITFSSPTTGGSITYNWTNSNTSIGLGASGSGNIASFTAINAGSTSVTATITATPSFTNAGKTCTGTATAFTITVNPTPQGSLTANGPFCTSGAGQLTFTSTAGTGPFRIVYNDGSSNQTVSNVTSGTPFNVASNPVTATTTYTLVSVTDNNGCVRTSGFTGTTATINVYAPPAITADPSDATVCATFPVSFTVTATGDGLTYQWYKGATPLADNGFISGSNTATLTIDPTAATDAGTYHVVVSGLASCAAATSADATLTIDQIIVITSQPTASQTLCEGDTYTLNITATGSNLSYQWRTGTTNLTDGGNISGANSSTLTISNITTADASTQYNVVIIDAAVDPGDCNTAFSNKATLIINKKSSDPASATASSTTICNGGSTMLTLGGGGGGTGEVIKWYSGSCGGTLVGSGNNLIVNPTTTTTYFGRYEDPAPCNYNSNCATVTITVNQKSADPTSASASATTICNGQSTTLTLNGGGGGTGEMIKWYTGSCGTTLAGTGNNLSVSPTVTTTYYGRYEDGTPCNYNSACVSVTITVNQKSSNPVSATASAPTICNGGSTTLTLVGGGGGTNPVITWYTGSCGGTLAGTGNGLSVSPTTTTTYFGRYENGAPCNFSTLCASVTVTVNQPPTTSNAGADQSVCGTSTTLSANAPTIGTGAWSIVSGAGGTVTTPSSRTSTFSGTAGNTYTLRWTISNAPCTVSTDDVIIAFKQNPTTANAGADQTVCGTSTTLNGNSPSTGTGSWTIVSGTGGTIANPSSRNSSFTGVAGTTYVLRWTISNSPCTPSSDDVSITLDPVISNDSIFLASMCRNPSTGQIQIVIGQAPPGISGGSGSYTYSWAQSCNGSSSFVPVSGANGSSLVLTPTAGFNCFYQRYVTSSPCAQETSKGGNGDKIHVNIKNSIPPSPFLITPSPSASYCTGGSGVQVGTNGSLPDQPTDPFTPYTVWYKLYLDGALVDSLEGTGNPLNFGYKTSAGTYTITETINLLTPGAISCGPTTLSNSLTISIDQLPTTSIAGVNQNICGTIATLAGNTPTIGTGLWSITSGSGTITTPSSPTSGVTALAAGNNVFKWTISNGTCPSSSSQVTIIAYSPTVVPSSLNAAASTVCDGSSTTITQTGGSLGTGTASWKWYSDPSYTTLAGMGSGATASLTVSPSATTTYYLRGEISSFTPCTANTPSGSITINVNKRPTASWGPDQTLCNGSASLSVTFTGTGPWTFAYSTDNCVTKTTVTTSSNPYTFPVTPGATSTYKICSLSDANCTAIASDYNTTSSTVTVLTGAAGLWTGAISNDWFNCLNWENGYVPTSTTNVTIPATTNSPQINAAGAQTNDITINGGTLTFGASGTLEVYGNFTDNVASTAGGFTGSAGTIIFSGSSLQTITTAKDSVTFYNLQINKTSTDATALVLLDDNITVTNDLTLTKGIFVTGYHLFTFNNTGTLNLPANYTDSYIATSDASGTPLNVANPTTPFTGDVGFRIKNVGATDTYFPVGSTYLPAETGQLPSPNRMMLNNKGAVQDFTVVVNDGDIGYTNGSGGALRVNRIWYVSASLGTAQATMQLFFTKRSWMGWGSLENEVEAGFNYGQPALVEKDYTGLPSGFMNLSSGSDINNFIGYPDGSEIYGLYSVNISNNLSNGITQFNRFSVVNPGDIILPVTVVNLRAYPCSSAVCIDWSALNEINTDHYEVQRAFNGIDFIGIGTIKAQNRGSSSYYSLTDKTPLKGNSFYRVKVFGDDGGISYTGIVKVNIGIGKGSISIYPNPVQNKLINVQISNLPNGRYQLLLYNSTGQKVYSKVIEHAGGSATHTLLLPRTIAGGPYFVKVFNSSMNFVISLVIE